MNTTNAQLDPDLAALVDMLAEFVVEDCFRELQEQPQPSPHEGGAP